MSNFNDDDLVPNKVLQELFPALPKSKNALKRMEKNGFPPSIAISERVRARHLGGVKAYLKKQEQEAKERSEAAFLALPVNEPAGRKKGGRK